MSGAAHKILASTHIFICVCVYIYTHTNPDLYTGADSRTTHFSSQREQKREKREKILEEELRCCKTCAKRMGGRSTHERTGTPPVPRSSLAS
jgi:hypothetical protein